LIVWNSEVPILANGLKIADIVICDRWACVDEVREQNPGWRLRTMTFTDFIRPLVADLLPNLVSDPAAEARIRIELTMSARVGEWVPAKTLHSHVPSHVRSNGAWNSALAQLTAEGRLLVRHRRITPTASRPRTEFFYVPPAEPARN